MIESFRAVHSRHYERLAIYPVPLILNHMKSGRFTHPVAGTLSLYGKRYRVFLKHGTECVACGIKAKYFALEKDPQATKYHLNMYAVSKKGIEIMMTRDHIKPRAKGGTDALANQQTMCFYCNMQKADKYDEDN